jgi:hypothetical protein
MMESQKIELKLTADNRILIRTAKHEAELVAHKSGIGERLCVPAQQNLDGARVIELSDPLWWLDARGEWVEVEYTRVIA